LAGGKTLHTIKLLAAYAVAVLPAQPVNHDPADPRLAALEDGEAFALESASFVPEMAQDGASLSDVASTLPLSLGLGQDAVDASAQGGDAASLQPVFEVSAAAPSALLPVKTESESESATDSLSQVMSRLAQQVYDVEFETAKGSDSGPILADVAASKPASKTAEMQIASNTYSAALLSVPAVDQRAPTLPIGGSTLPDSPPSLVAVASHDDAALLPSNWTVDQAAQPVSAPETQIGFTSPIPAQPLEISGAARAEPLDTSIVASFAPSAAVPIAMSWPVRLAGPPAPSKRGATVIRTAGFTSAIPAQPFESSAAVRAAPPAELEASPLVAPSQAPAFSVFPSERPAIDAQLADMNADPILSLSQGKATASGLREVVGLAVARHPAMGEAIAGAEEANAARAEASAQRFATVDLSVSSFQTISRAFSNDPQNINERSRARQRTDATLNISQPVFDFGATSNRISSARSRLVASQAEIDATSDRIALGVVGAWYDVFAFRSMKALSESFVVSQEELRGAVKVRIAQGVSAAGDIAQVDSYIGSAKRRVAEFERERASAEARYFELVGEEAPANISRIAGVVSASMSKDMAQYAARSTAAVASAEAVAEASRRDARAARAALLPNLSVGVDAGRYGVFETQRDYDIRARITLRQRFFGGTEQNADRAIARSHAATARADRIREESARDASIAWSDVKALEAELSAVEASYIASRRSRDVLVERFKVSRGTLFDVLGAEDNLFQSAASYVRTMTQLDSARFVLLSRTGKLMTALELPSAQGLSSGPSAR
jgi:outer membrane protein, adhesin transport system